MSGYLEQDRNDSVCRNFDSLNEREYDFTDDWVSTEDLALDDSLNLTDGRIIARLPDLGQARSLPNSKPKQGIFSAGKNVVAGTITRIFVSFRSMKRPIVSARSDSHRRERSRKLYGALAVLGLIVLLGGLYYSGSNSSKDTGESLEIPLVELPSDVQRTEESSDTAVQENPKIVIADAKSEIEVTPKNEKEDAAKVEAESKTPQSVAIVSAVAEKNTESKKTSIVETSSPWDRAPTDSYSPWAMKPQGLPAVEAVDSGIEAASETAPQVAGMENPPSPAPTPEMTPMTPMAPMAPIESPTTPFAAEASRPMMTMQYPQQAVIPPGHAPAQGQPPMMPPGQGAAPVMTNVPNYYASSSGTPYHPVPVAPQQPMPRQGYYPQQNQHPSQQASIPARQGNVPIPMAPSGMMPGGAAGHYPGTPTQAQMPRQQDPRYSMPSQPQGAPGYYPQNQGIANVPAQPPMTVRQQPGQPYPGQVPMGYQAPGNVYPHANNTSSGTPYGRVY